MWLVKPRALRLLDPMTTFLDGVEYYSAKSSVTGNVVCRAEKLKITLEIPPDEQVSGAPWLSKARGLEGPNWGTLGSPKRGF